MPRFFKWSLSFRLTQKSLCISFPFPPVVPYAPPPYFLRFDDPHPTVRRVQYMKLLVMQLPLQPRLRWCVLSSLLCNLLPTEGITSQWVRCETLRLHLQLRRVYKMLLTADDLRKEMTVTPFTDRALYYYWIVREINRIAKKNFSEILCLDF